MADIGFDGRIAAAEWGSVIPPMVPLLREGRADDALIAGLDALDALLTARGFAGDGARVQRAPRCDDARGRGRPVSTLASRARLAALVALAAASCVALAADVPYLTGRVVDNANVLSAGAKQKIAQIAEAREKASGDQIAVLTMPSLEGESIEGYATRVFDAWKLGQKGKDNGVLVIVAPSDRKMRIEVGYGLEGTLTDAAAARIIREAMTPRFKSNDFDGGVTAGVQAIVDTLEGRGDWASGGTGSTETSTSSKKSALASIDEQLPPWPMRILLGAFIFGIIGLFTFIGVMTPGMGWFLYFFLIPFWAMFPIVVLGVKGALVLLGDLRGRLPDREAHREPPAVVREGRAGNEDEGHDDDRRHGRVEPVGRRARAGTRRAAAGSRAAGAAPAAAGRPAAGETPGSGASRHHVAGLPFVGGSRRFPFVDVAPAGLGEQRRKLAAGVPRERSARMLLAQRDRALAMGVARVGAREPRVRVDRGFRAHADLRAVAERDALQLDQRRPVARSGVGRHARVHDQDSRLDQVSAQPLERETRRDRIGDALERRAVEDRRRVARRQVERGELLPVEQRGAPVVARRAAQSASAAADASAPCIAMPRSTSGTSRRPEPHIASRQVPASRGKRATYQSISSTPGAGRAASSKRARSTSSAGAGGECRGAIAVRPRRAPRRSRRRRCASCARRRARAR